MSMRKNKPTKRTCVKCRRAKQALEFPTTAADTCTSCTHLHADTPETPDANDEPSDVVFKLDENEVLDASAPTLQELAARTLARRRLLSFIKRFKPKYLAGWVHEDICRRLEQFMRDVENGAEPRLLLCVPVRHGKSEIGSRHFAPWVLGQHPDWEVIAASGAQALATSFSRYIRDLMRSDTYRALFPDAVLDPSSQSVENWNTTAGGGYLAAGVGTMITGRGAHVLILDDVVKDAEAADSQVIRDGIWEWYLSTALSRLAPGGGVLVIMTWWNEDDLAGRLQKLNDMGVGGDEFQVVRYPAINDQGDEYILADDNITQLPPGSTIPHGARLTRVMGTALHPERYSRESLLKRKATYYALGQQRWWAALYQQAPAIDDGVFFKSEMFKFFRNLPSELDRAMYQTWDFAITEKQQSDYTVCATGMQDTDGNLYVVDVIRFKSDDSFVIADAILDAWVKHGACARIGFEDGVIWKTLHAVFKRRCAERQLFPAYDLLVPVSDKAARAQPMRGLMQGGRVLFKERAQWWDEVKKEMTQFLSGGKHDDIVDALAWLTRLALGHRVSSRRPKQRKPASWKDSWTARSGGGMERSHMSS